jgi:hypothetical protein
LGDALKTVLMAALFLLSLVARADDLLRVAEILDGIETPRDEPISFVEKRQSQLLAEPLILHGHVSFSQDGVLAKNIDRPFRESVRITDERMELERDGKTRRVSLDKRAGVKVFYAGMRALLNGDANALFELFDVTAEDVDERWRIRLIPKADELRTFVEKLTISGRGNQVLTVHTDQPGGDWQEMSFSPVTD